ncbi:MAG TPA: GAF domain-containing protein, partial [Gaiellaceae bacterium]|nr:GAF domain-containing protein [Gaiellaceae bacterium]
MVATSTAQDRMRALVEAGIALTSELSLDAVLQKLIETAATLTGARYAALGVLDPTGSRLERFVTTGIDAETHARIGDLPTGRGILGVLIRDARALRLRDLGEDPRSVGFPPGHPPMRSFLGVPVALRGVSYGNLYLTEKEAGDFTQEDEEAVVLLAAQAAVAIENARLYESVTRWSSQLESLNEVALALVSEFELGPLLQTIAVRLGGLIGAEGVSIALPRGDGLRIEAVAGSGSDEVIGMSIPARSKTMRVLERKHSERVDSVLDDPEIDQETARRMKMVTGLYVPLVLRGDAIGVITAQDKQGSDPRFTDDDVRVAEGFAQRAAVAVDLSRRVARDALQRVVSAQEQERRRLARELHDETGQALTSILLGLKTVEEAKDEHELSAAIAEVRDLVRSTLQDVRQLAIELRPKALDDFGLVAALERLTSSFEEQTGIAMQFQSSLPPGRLPPEVETALYRIAQESLTNIVKHARASSVSIVVGRKEDAVSVVVEDDGVGFDPARTREEGLGLIGMRERVALLGGRLTIESRPG